jgi:hypothetical protein
MDKSSNAADKPSTKYRAEVTGIGEMRWSSNAKRFDNREEAEKWLTGLAMRWTGYDMSRVVPADTPDREPVETETQEIFQNFRK